MSRVMLQRVRRGFLSWGRIGVRLCRACTTRWEVEHLVSELWLALPSQLGIHGGRAFHHRAHDASTSNPVTGNP